MWEETLFGEVFNENLGFKEWQKYRKLGCVAIYNMMELEDMFVEIVIKNCKDDKQLFSSFQWVVCDKSNQRKLKQ